MTSKRSIEDVEDIEIGDMRRQRVYHPLLPLPAQAPPLLPLPAQAPLLLPRQPPVHHMYKATIDGVTRFYPRKIETITEGVLSGVYTDAFKTETFACSRNINRPCLTPVQLGISPENFLCGIAYSPQRMTIEQKAEHLVHFKSPTGTTYINDVQSGITGSVTTTDIAPFRDVIVKIRDSVRDFYTSPMQCILDGCGDRDAFIDILRRTTQRETFEETGLFGDSGVFEFVTTHNNFAIFKVNVSLLSKQKVDVCATFVQQSSADFFLEHLPGYTGRGRGLPFKIQVYIYGHREDFKKLISGHVYLPSVKSETDIAGLMIFRAADVEQFRMR
jgi:hypothetical protein